METRLSIVLQSQPGTRLNWGYREGVQGYIYKILRNSPLGDKIHKDKFSLFCFQLLPIGAVMSKEGLSSSSGTWILRIASAYEEVLTILEQAAREGKVQIGDNEFKTVLVAREPLHISSEYEVDSVLVFDKEKKFLLAWEDGYEEAIVGAIKNRWEFMYQTKAPEVSFEFTEKPRVYAQNYKNRKLLTHHGTIHLESTPEMLKFIQCVGLGQKESCGFGMVV